MSDRKVAGIILSEMDAQKLTEQLNEELLQISNSSHNLQYHTVTIEKDGQAYEIEVPIDDIDLLDDMHDDDLTEEGERSLGIISSEFDKFISGYGPVGGPEEVLPKKFLLPPLRPRPSSSMRPSEMSIPPSIPKLPDAIRAADSIAGRTSRSSLKPLPLAFSPSVLLRKLAPLPPINESVNSSGGSRYRKLNMKQKIKQKNNNNKTKKNILRIVRNKRRRKSKKIINYNYKKVMKTKKINKNK
jgi:hypothetical protein